MIGYGLMKNTSLRSLILKGNRLGDTAGEHLAKGKLLEYIDLSG